MVIVAAARVGGIHANNAYPAEFMSENLAIARNTAHGSYQAGVKKLLFLGSSCIYPKLARQPMREEELLTGSLEPSTVADRPAFTSPTMKPEKIGVRFANRQTLNEACRR